MSDPTSFDILIIGGGHAGAEAAWAASHILAARGPERRVGLVTMDPAAIGRMSCNPAIGGLAKGQMVREIDALGGLMAHAIDAAGIQFRMLNRSKGPAVQSPRAQADKYEYARAVQRLLRDHCPNLTIITGIVDRFLTAEGRAAIIRAAGGNPRPTDLRTMQPPASNENAPPPRRIAGIVLEDGRALACRAVVVTTGTFLRALMHTGETKTEGGRIGEQTARGLSASLAALGLELGRLKTGTPPRLAKETIDFAALEEQPGDTPPIPFSELTLPSAVRPNTQDSGLRTQDYAAPTQSSVLSPHHFPALPQVPMHITHTNARVHDLIRANLHRAPMYSGQIQSRGPRYCPSIEDKVVRFADKDRHQIFLEPESLTTNEIYANGISTSLPADVQEQIVHAIAGLEHAKILKYGYAVEYDFVPTHQINASLETRAVAGLFLAGQINGTSGYEEAAGQGLLAGINAARGILNLPPVVLTRDQAYIGVMIDDLITKTPTEPYRMFTSRAEFRLSLRSDNADQRLTPLGHNIGLASDARLARLQEKLAGISELTAQLKSTRLHIDGSSPTAYDYLRRPDITWPQVAALLPSPTAQPLTDDQERRTNNQERRTNDQEPMTNDPALWRHVEIEAKYSGYIERERQAAARLHDLEDKTIPASFDFAALPDLRKEAKQALQKFRPATLGQASRLEGITPNDLTVLLIYLRAKAARRAG